MHIIVIIDDDRGMLFNGRRQSKDTELRKDMLKFVGNGRLFMNAYSYGQFGDEYPPNGGEITVSDPVVCVWEDFLAEAGEDDYCLVENLSVGPFADKIQKIIIYKWNRKYPSDKKFDFSMEEWTLESSENIAGRSHEMITREVWMRR